MPDDDLWKPRLDGRGGPVYLAIADAMAADIGAGRLVPGERLPTQRALAEALGIDLTTVTRAYAEARHRGLLSGVVGRGTFISDRAAADMAPLTRGDIDMSMNVPPQPLALLRTHLAQGLERLVRAPDLGRRLGYRAAGGGATERTAGAAWLRRRYTAAGVAAVASPHADRVLVAPGAQAALHALLSLLAQRADVVLAETLSYPGFTAIAARLGLRVVAVACDGEGLLPDAVEAACRSGGARLLYCTPTHHNPTTATMSESRRQALAAVIQAQGLTVVEDDAYGALAAAPGTPLAALVPAQVWHVATLSKCLTPALRTAYVAAPDAIQAERFEGVLRTQMQMPSPLAAGLAADWILDGTAATLAEAIRTEAAARQRLAAELLPPGGYQAQPDSLHLWLSLPPDWTPHAFVQRAARTGLTLVAGDAFLSTDTPVPAAVRLALGAAPDTASLKGALIRVAGLLAGPKGGGAPGVI
ncbi:PLP-dependent aminotransferase family protein [Nitrospirillum sp. BR 11163]|uniref:aminotransferase-like domain-containing protein n=1 Tax=Nitrospirillum sp. BR 11163 TaxID=3104323 RepID=UPI002AFE7ED9|nr:PLP-dependent aminotransferase family protein [Nitrospirillum sp. BR 11163]MEA1672464.1 PLP-dependent aminotransferase family protein [Nitrospirillum sp. BR 11163]